MNELQALASTPEFWSDQKRAREVIAQTNALKAVLDPYAEVQRLAGDAVVFLEMAAAADSDGEREAAAQEAAEAGERAGRLCEELEVKVLLSGRLDGSNAYLNIHAGAGGTESCDWADMLLRMFMRYAERHGFAVTLLDHLPGEEAGTKSVSLHIAGPYAYGYLKSERGVHRLVRISPYDAAKRRHTSFAAVDVVAELDEDVEIEINEKDLRVDTYRSGGAGGQHVNKTDSAVRLVHLPTGIVVACQAERSQHSNRDKAMRMLRAKLYELEQDKKRQEMEHFYGEKGEISWGRQIRSYVMQPYTLVKDHRTDMEVGNVQAVLDGDLDKFVDAFLRQKAAQNTGAPAGA